MPEYLQLSGILKSSNFSPKDILHHGRLQKVLREMPGHIPIPDAELHITLLDQHVLRGWRSVVRDMFDVLPEPPLAQLGRNVFGVGRQNRSSLIVVVENQVELRGYVGRCMNAIGMFSGLQPPRVFHLSIANLTGDPMDSVGDVNAGDFANGCCTTLY